MAQTSGYYLIGFNGIDAPADMNKTNIVEDSVAETRLAALLGSKGIDIPFLLSDKGVVIRGADIEHAPTISRTVANHPALALPEVETVSKMRSASSAFALVAGVGYVEPAILYPAPRVVATTITGKPANLATAPVAMAA